KESLQHKLDRVRKPRVQITYDVEVGDAMETKELPFVVGVMGDFSGNPDQPLPALKDRKLVEIDRDNFNKVLAGMKPRLAFRTDDKLSGKDDSQLNVELRFKNLDDFAPENVAKQIEPLNKLLVQRDKLKNLLNKLEGNDKLEELLQNVLQNADALDELTKELGGGGSGSESPASSESESPASSESESPASNDSESPESNEEESE
ncbi:MAG: type VI secretion system contractile sheath small subunit, partial [Planctomycetes bacterium]|nr:type VI secretion system contractile sheath small subunit [Planctomycetota bacterium]